MELKPGYKQTEVGVIPEDWEMPELGDIGFFKNGINKDSQAFGHGSRFLNLMDVFGVSKIESIENFGLVDCSAAEKKVYNLQEGDVIFVRSSVKPSGVGLTAVIETEFPDTVYSGFLIRFRDAGHIATSYKRHCFFEEGFRNRVIAASSVSANTNINQNNLASIAIALPPTKAEQEAIAETLSDADTLIESLEQLIAKKRQIKQGAMQELLTGKRRLPGFEVKAGYKQTEVGVIPEDWHVTMLSGLATMKSGESITSSNIDQFSRYPCFGGNGLRGYTTRFTHDGCHALIGRQGALCGNVLGVEGQFFASEHAIVVTPYPQIDIKWLTFVLGRMHLNRYSESSAQPGLSVAKILSLVTATPPTKTEQTAIAVILNDMDTEIETIEAKLAKARQVKQGMMQELLTGRIRLI